jgi:hypothetical protein
MPELDPFEARLTAAVRSFAGRAETSVDAMAVAERTVRRRRTGSLGALGRLLPVPVSLLLLLALLLAMLAWSVQVGAPWGNRAVLLAPAPSATPTPTATTAPIATPVPSTSGTGDQHVVGTMTGSLTTPYMSTPGPNGMTYIRGGVMTAMSAANDPRASGVATFTFNLDTYTNVGSE